MLPKMKTNFTFLNLRKAKKQALILFFVVLSSFAANAQLGVYSFTGVGACPNQNPAVTLQPANAVFSNFQPSIQPVLRLQMCLKPTGGIQVTQLTLRNTMSLLLHPTQAIAKRLPAWP